MKGGEHWTEREERAAEEALGYTFRDKALLRACFTHMSYANANGGQGNGRLEFLGDAVLQLVVTDQLYRTRKESEGVLTKLRQRLVCKEALVRAESRADLMRFLLYTGGADNLGGKTPSDLFEAVVAGLYLDGGMEAAERFLERTLSMTEESDYISLLQEWLQAKGEAAPVPAYESVEGGYVCKIEARGLHAEGRGANKQAAHREAAERLFKLFNARSKG